MPAYLYVLWAVEDELVKVGISVRPDKRISAHTANSSNPLRFVTWKLYQFEQAADARKIESLTVKCLQKRGFRHPKRELFNCEPTTVTTVIDELCHEAGICPLKNFPPTLNDILLSFGSFPSLPSYGLEVLTSEQRSLYWRGAEDALGCIGCLDGLTISRSDFWQIQGMVRELRGANSELWTTIVDHYRNGQSDANRETANAALDEIKEERRFAFNDWQNVRDDDSVEEAHGLQGS